MEANVFADLLRVKVADHRVTAPLLGKLHASALGKNMDRKGLLKKKRLELLSSSQFIGGCHPSPPRREVKRKNSRVISVDSDERSIQQTQGAPLAALTSAENDVANRIPCGTPFHPFLDGSQSFDLTSSSLSLKEEARADGLNT